MNAQNASVERESPRHATPKEADFGYDVSTNRRALSRVFGDPQLRALDGYKGAAQ